MFLRRIYRLRVYNTKMVTPHRTYLQNSLQCRDLSLQSRAVVVGSDMQRPIRALGKREKAYDSKCS